MSDHIDKELEAKLQSKAEEGCVDTRQFDAGTKLYVETERNVYEILFTEPENGMVMARNGSNWLEEIEVRFNGCTWGGSCLKMGAIGKGMHMEFQYLEGPKGGKVHTTTHVQTCKIVGPNEAWNFELWEDEDEDTV